MTKKIFALVMVIGVLGAAFLTGCKKDETTDAGTTSGAPATSAPASS